MSKPSDRDLVAWALRLLEPYADQPGVAGWVEAVAEAEIEPCASCECAASVVPPGDRPQCAECLAEEADAA